MSPSLGQQMARTAGIFQGITALPVMFYMGETALNQLYYPYIRFYWFITAVCTGLMAAAIVFIIFVQRHPKNTRTSTFYFEIVKSGLASVLWLWLILDSIFGPVAERYYQPPEDIRVKKIVQAAFCFLILPFLFYPTLVFAFFDRKWAEEGAMDEEGQEGDVVSGAEGERQPLLGTTSS